VIEKIKFALFSSFVVANTCKKIFYATNATILSGSVNAARQ
jgi:hypothetical protein